METDMEVRSPPLDRPSLDRSAGHRPLVRSTIAGIGAYLPELVVTNDELAKTVETSDAWIRERTGILQRHIAGKHETCAFMATRAAQAALADAQAEAGEVDAIIVGTATPDEAFPSVAVRVQGALGIGGRSFGFDVSAACSGFIYALSVADAHDPHGPDPQRPGDRLRSLFPHHELARPHHLRPVRGRGGGGVAARRNRCPGLAAGAGGTAAPGILSTHLHADGSLGDILYVDGAVGQPDRPGHLVMNGREVFRQAVHRLVESVDEALAVNGLARSDIDWLVPHQANARIIDAVGRRLGLSAEQVIVTVDRHANTSAASIPLALATGWADGRIKRGQLVLMEALGGGLTWGSALVRL